MNAFDREFWNGALKASIMIEKDLKKLLKEAELGAKVGIRRLHAHLFRHFYATQLYGLTNDLRMVQILVGHARIETTTIYEHMTSAKAAEKGRDAVEKLFGMKGI